MTLPDIMVDLETLGPTPGSVVVSIGAVAFDPKSNALGSQFYAVINPASAQAAGLTIDGETVLWWMDKSDAARAALTNGPTFGLRETLISFSTWWQQHEGVRFWGHGANFDDPVLAAAYRAAGLKPPWRYSNSRCTRTVFDMAGSSGPDRAAGVHHNALDDAIAQAVAVQAAYEKLGLSTAPQHEVPLDQMESDLRLIVDRVSLAGPMKPRLDLFTEAANRLQANIKELQRRRVGIAP